MKRQYSMPVGANDILHFLYLICYITTKIVTNRTKTGQDLRPAD